MVDSQRLKLNNVKENGAKWGFLLCAFLSLGLLAVIVVFLFVYGSPFLFRYGVGNFLFGMSWNPLGEPATYGVWPMIVATFYVTGLSAVVGCVFGLFVAISLFAFVPKRLVRPIRALIDLLAGIPSVIYGLFGLIIIVPFIRDYISPNGVGYGILAASIILSIMILPTMVGVSLDALNSVDHAYYEGALSLGSSRSQAIFKVMVPSAKRGILAACVLSTGRALGETMAVIMVIGGSSQLPTSLTQPVRTLTTNIAMGAMELQAIPDALSALFCSGVVLFLFSLLLNVLFSVLEGRKK